MKIYVVGGAVRDALLDLPVQDRDYVVVGATPGDMLARGFTAVGKDFPVFLHPKTHEEYALARTERKTAPGYKGFAFHAAADVTLEQDLSRRDLTINAIAQAEDGNLIDPFNGKQDIAGKVFRHVSPAFAEDPVRILRVARFAARLPDFTVAAATNALMRQMVANGEVDALVPERVWQEISRGLMEIKPSRMFAVLRDCGALARILPELDALWGVSPAANSQPQIDAGTHAMRVVDTAARLECSLPVRFAALTQGLGMVQAQPGEAAPGVQLVEQACKRLKIPNDCRDLAVMTAREHGNIGQALALSADAIVTLFERCDAFRKPQRFADMLRAAECEHCAGRENDQDSFAQAAHLAGLLQAARQVDAGAIARQCSEPQKIAESVHAARVAAVAASMPQQA